LSEHDGAGNDCGDHDTARGCRECAPTAVSAPKTCLDSWNHVNEVDIVREVRESVVQFSVRHR
jgi:hypothetical protein